MAYGVTSEMVLPNYILEQIFTHLDFTYAYELSLVCRSFYNFVMTSSHLWSAWWHSHLWLFRELDVNVLLEGEQDERKGKGKMKGEKDKGDREGREGGERMKEKKDGKDRDSMDTRDWMANCRLRYEYELDQVDCTSDICWVALQGNTRAIRKLVSLGVSLHYDAQGKTTPLHCAAERSNTRAMRVLIQLGADVNASRDVAPLHIAARYGRTEAIEFLLAQGARIDCASSPNAATPLHFAAISGAPAIHSLVRMGASVNARNKYLDTPLHEAADSCNVLAARELVRLGADVNACNDMGCTPLHCAADRTEGRAVEIVRELVAMGACVDAEDSLGIIPYHLAVWRGHAELAEELALLGSRVDKPPDGALLLKCSRPGEFVYTPGHGYVKKNVAGQI